MEPPLIKHLSLVITTKSKFLPNDTEDVNDTTMKQCKILNQTLACPLHEPKQINIENCGQ